MENIKQIRQAEGEAKKMVDKARKESEIKIAEVRQELSDIQKMAEEELKPKLKKMEQETEKAIAEYEKIGEEEQKIVLEKLDETDNLRLEKAVGLVVERMS